MTSGTNGRSFVRSIARSEHDDDRERQLVLVLLMSEPAVYRKQRIKRAIRGEAKQRTVSGAGPSHVRDGSNLVGWKGRSLAAGARTRQAAASSCSPARITLALSSTATA